MWPSTEPVPTYLISDSGTVLSYSLLKNILLGTGSQVYFDYNAEFIEVFIFIEIFQLQNYASEFM